MHDEKECCPFCGANLWGEKIPEELKKLYMIVLKIVQ